MDSGPQRGSAALPLKVAMELAHVVVQDVARAAGIRVLFFKGPVANSHELRPPRVSSDVDVFVEPSRLEDLAAALSRLGWRRRPASTAHESFVTHSISLSHERWPVDIDVHHAYPGVFAPPDEFFETIWERRTTVEIAHAEITGADFESSAVLAALHSLRSMYFARQREEYDYALAAVKRRYPNRFDRKPFGELARSLRCDESLAPFLSELGVAAASPAVPSAEYRLWAIKSQEMSRAASWLLLLTELRGWTRLRLLGRAVFPSRRDLELDHPDVAAQAVSVTRSRLRRFAAGAAAMPSAVRAVVALRRSGSLQLGERTRFSAPSYGLPTSEAPRRGAPLVKMSCDEQSVPLSRDGHVELSRSECLAFVEEEAAYVVARASPEGRVPLVFAGSARLLWDATERPTTVEKVVHEVANQTGLPLKELRPQVFAFFNDLLRYGVLVSR